MGIIPRIALAVMLACPAAIAAGPESESKPAYLVVRLLPLDARGLDPALTRAVPGLLAAAVESGGGCVAVADSGSGVSGGPEAGWLVRPSVSGKRPWKLSARAEGGSTGGARSFSTRKFEFSDRETLTDAVDALAAQLHTGWRDAGVRLAGAGPVTLRRTLSPSAAAADAYLAAILALRSGRAEDGLSSLREALAADPGFSLAAAERAYADLTSGDRAGALGSLAAARRARAGSPDPEPAAALLDGLELVAGGDAAAALGLADRMAAGGATARWALTLRGLLLAATGGWQDARESWQQAAELDPADPRPRYWLGLARMASGDFQGAAANLEEARAGWPSLLRAYTLRAECQARQRDTVAARATLEGLKASMTERGIGPSSDEENPDLMLGSVDLLEGNSTAALDRFEKTLAALLKAKAPPDLTWTLHTTIIQMRRDYAIARDPLARSRQLDEARDAMERFRESLPADLREQVPCVFLRFEGLIHAKAGETVEAWRAIEKMKSYAGTRSYSEVDEAYLTAATMLKEGDLEGCAAQFERLARLRGGIVDLIDLSQVQARLKRYDEARAGYLKVEERLARHEAVAFPPRFTQPVWVTGDAPRSVSELILVDPHLAALVPFYHYARARLAYETGDATDSRRHFNRMLKYYRDPDDKVIQLVKEAIARGAKPE